MSNVSNSNYVPVDWKTIDGYSSEGWRGCFINGKIRISEEDYELLKSCGLVRKDVFEQLKRTGVNNGCAPRSSRASSSTPSFKASLSLAEQAREMLSSSTRLVAIRPAIHRCQKDPKTDVYRSGSWTEHQVKAMEEAGWTVVTR